MIRSLWLKIVIACAITILVIGGLAYLGIRKFNQIREERELATTLLKRPDISITIVEGKRREEIANLLQEKGICTASAFLAASEGKEGMLFPDTYRFFADTPATEVVTDLTDNYARKTRELNPTPEQLVLASIVEREAERDADRAAIAGIYNNRLKVGMKLEADPTVQYSKDTLTFAAAGKPTTYKFWSAITQAEYKSVKSDFNTYLITGLPPAPIDNPGIKSIEAAVHPAQHSYYFLYYKNGVFMPSKTLQEHINKQY